MRVRICVVAASLFFAIHSWVLPASAAQSATPSGQADKSAADKCAFRTILNADSGRT